MFKGLGNLGDMSRMMKAAQEMQGKMAEVQEGLGRITVEGTAGGGLVRATATAKGEREAAIQGDRHAPPCSSQVQISRSFRYVNRPVSWPSAQMGASA